MKYKSTCPRPSYPGKTKKWYPEYQPYRFDNETGTLSSDDICFTIRDSQTQIAIGYVIQTPDSKYPKGVKIVANAHTVSNNKQHEFDPADKSLIEIADQIFDEWEASLPLLKKCQRLWRRNKKTIMSWVGFFTAPILFIITKDISIMVSFVFLAGVLLGSNE